MSSEEASHLENRFYPPKDLFMSMMEICENYGFKLEEHRITVEDGYILTMFHLISPDENEPDNWHERIPDFPD